VLVTPTAAGDCPDIVVRKAEQPHAIPRSAWIHASDGVNVRSAASSTAARLTTLPTGTALVLQAQQAGSDGGTWYRIHLADGRNGWLSGGFTTNYPISPASTDSLKIWLPHGYAFQTAAPGMAEARYAGAPLALLYVQSGPKDQAPMEMTMPMPASVPLRSTWREGSQGRVLVGDLPAVDRVFSITLVGGGCPAVVHEVRVSTASRYYIFRFLLDEPSSAVVAQALDSATLE
jgi:Bacterial SH3 domain